MTSQELIQKAKKVKIILFDVDGILTSGLVNIMPYGSDLYTFNVYDGYGIKLWQRAGFKTGFITASPDVLPQRRFAVEHGQNKRRPHPGGVAREFGVFISFLK